MLASFLVLWWERKRDTNRADNSVRVVVIRCLIGNRQSVWILDLMCGCVEGKDLQDIYLFCTPACATRARGDSILYKV